MMDRFSKGLTYAMIPSGIVGLLMLVFFILLGFAFIIVTHVVAFESMFPAESITTVYSNYAPPEVMDNTPSPTLYPLFLCLFIDISILLGVCKLFKINFGTALAIVLFVLFAPVTIPILIIMFFVSKCNNTVSSASSENYSAPKYSKSNHSDLADKF